MLLHFRCRGECYPLDKSIKRFLIKDEKVPWSVSFPEYNPTIYTFENIVNSSFTDPDLLSNSDVKLKFNELDGKIDRRSHEGVYRIENGIPLNPIGRTGIQGRGFLYYWGPNHAADPVVTTWKRDENNEFVFHPESKKKILKFVGIFRKHDKEWALPGGMVDPGETVTNTIKREFSEEALNTLIKTDQERKELSQKIDNLFINGKIIYKGYVDDPRNTDNAWLETVAMNFHDEDGTSLAKIHLEAGDDATAIRWIDLDSKLHLFASHLDILKKLVEIHDAHW